MAAVVIEIALFDDQGLDDQGLEALPPTRPTPSAARLARTPLAPAPAPAPARPTAVPSVRSGVLPKRSPSAPSREVFRRRRIVACGVAGVVLLGMFFGLHALLGRLGGGPLASFGSPAAAQPAPRVWVVRPGDTLWSIALASGGQGDIRPLVDRLSAEVGGRPLQPGERIRVPPPGPD